MLYAPEGFSEEISIETIVDPQLHPKLQANEIKLTPVIRILPQQIADEVIIELMKTIEPNRENTKIELVPLYSLSHPLEWKKLPSHDCEMFEDRVTFKTDQFGYFTVIAQFSLPTNSVTVKPSLDQPAQLTIPELPGFKLEIPPTSVQSNTDFVATVHYNDPSMYDDLSNHSSASVCVVLEPHNTNFKDKIMIMLPIPNYDQIKLKYPNIELELWHTNNTNKGEPVKLKIAEESGIIIHRDGYGICLAAAYVTHFSGFMYLWDTVVDYCFNYFVQNIRGRCQAFMSRESKHGSWISFGIAVLFYPFKDPYPSLQNYPYMLCDSVLPITLTPGEIECQIELDKLLVQDYGSIDTHNKTCYTECRTFPNDFNIRMAFNIRLRTKSAVKLKLPEGILATLFIKRGSDEVHKFNLIKVNNVSDTNNKDDVSLLISNLIALFRP